MKIGKLKPMLVDIKLLEEIKKVTNNAPKEIIIKSALMEEVDYFFAAIMGFFRKYYLYIIGLIVIISIFYYLYISNKNNKETKKDKKEVKIENYINPGQYVKEVDEYGNEYIQLLQRPIPQDDTLWDTQLMNQEMRNIQLADFNHNNRKGRVYVDTTRIPREILNTQTV